MKNLTEAQSHLYNLLDEELAIMEHPSCSLEEMRSRVVHLVGRLEPYLGCHIDMSREADLRVISPTAVKELIRYTRSSERSFDEFLAYTSRVIGFFMTQEQRQEFFGEGEK
jgi:hypothetical protein